MQSIKTELEPELERIREEYRRRACCQAFTERYSLFNAATLLQSQSLERALLAMLKQRHLTQLAEKNILDIGCGGGLQLQRFLAYGAKPGNLFGIDLMPARIEQARSLHPAINWQTGSAHQLPYPAATFDLVTLFVVFSSILDEALCESIVAEIWRVLKPTGLILCYDFVYANPRNPAVRGVTPRQIQRLFQRPGATFAFQRVTLAPPISRLLAPHAVWLAAMLEHLKILNSHCISLIGLP